MDFEVRPMRPEEYELLDAFLYECIFVPEGMCPPPRGITKEPDLAVYTDRFGEQSGDEAFVAVRHGKVVGAAWARIMNDYGHLDDETPSMAIAVLESSRGGGAGTLLIRALAEKLRQDGYKSLSLSVQKANRAARLYERMGFELVAARTDEEDQLMRLWL